LVDLFVSPYSQKSMQTAARACLGGSVFNFCLASARQGLTTTYLNALSQDSFGRQFARLLQAESVHLAQSAPVAEPTSIAVIELDAQGKANYAFHRTQVADTALAPELIIEHMPAQTSAQTQLLHTGCLMLVPSAWPQTRAILAAARERGYLISVDANLRLSVCADLPAYRAAVTQACAMADIIKVSDDDLLACGWVQESHMTDPAQLMHAAASLLSERTRAVALTLGARGACWIDHSAQWHCPAPAGIIVKDTVGAGDSFMAALLAWLDRHALLTASAWRSAVSPQDAQQALRHAVAAAAVCVQREGCDPATWQEAASLAQTSISF
jgi:fructokinase